MNETKPWWQSVTIWGGIVAALCGLAQMFHIKISDDTQSVAVGVVISIATAISGITAIVGRVKAKHQITPGGDYQVCFALMLALGLGLTGCNASSGGSATTQPSAQVSAAPGSKAAFVAASNFLTASDQTLTNLRHQGWIPTITWQTQVIPAIDGAGRALDDWQAHLGDPAAAQYDALFQTAVANVVGGLADAIARQQAATSSNVAKPQAAIPSTKP